jgi:GT2 family glycosyltransferase
MTRKLTKPVAKKPMVSTAPPALIADLRELIAEARQSVAATVNAGLTLLYWRIGKRIVNEVLGQERAAYGQQIVVSLARQLVDKHGPSFGEKNLRRMMQFAVVFPKEEIVVSLIRQLSWTYFTALLPIKNPLQRDFYAELCRAEGWSVSRLRQKIDSMLFERTAVSRKPEELASKELDALRNDDQWMPDPTNLSDGRTLVIFPSFGHFNYVFRAVSSLVSVDPGAVCRPDYVIVDDASEEWNEVAWELFPDPTCWKVHFDTRGGLTRSWNHGLWLARKGGYRYVVCANTDILFGDRWLDPLVDALNCGCALVGPVTNAPGHCVWQNVRPFLELNHVQLDDSPEGINEVSHHLQSKRVHPIECPLNGFCLAATTETWWSGAFNDRSVFNPAFPLQHNEVELQQRWRSIGLSSSMVPRSYVFHYRSVSRPEGLVGQLAQGAFRPLSQTIDVIRR